MVRSILLAVMMLVTLYGFSQSNVVIENQSLSPAATVGGFMNGDNVAKKSFVNQVGVGVYLKNEKSQANVFKLTSFRATVLRNGVSVFNAENAGNIFNESTRSFFNSLEPGDIVLFSDLKTIQQDKDSKTSITELVLKPILYVIK
jgi:hypothetical protein